MAIKEYWGWGKFLLVDTNLQVHYGRIAVIALLAAAVALAVIWFQAATGKMPLSESVIYLPILAAALAVAGGLLGSLRHVRRDK